MDNPTALMAIERIYLYFLWASDPVVCGKIHFCRAYIVLEPHRCKDPALDPVGHIHGVKIAEGFKDLICPVGKTL